MDNGTPTITESPRRHNTGMLRTDISAADYARFEKLTDKHEGDSCWEFKGCRTYSGYGRFRFMGEKRGAHIFSYLYHVGDVAPKAEIDHRCHNRCCVNPAHLEMVSKQENLARRRY